MNGDWTEFTGLAEQENREEDCCITRIAALAADPVFSNPDHRVNPVNMKEPTNRDWTEFTGLAEQDNREEDCCITRIPALDADPVFSNPDHRVNPVNTSERANEP